MFDRAYKLGTISAVLFGLAIVIKLLRKRNRISVNFELVIYGSLFFSVIFATAAIAQYYMEKKHARSQSIIQNDVLVNSLYRLFNGDRLPTYSEYATVLANNFNTSTNLGLFTTYQRLVRKLQVNINDIRAEMTH